MNYELICCVSNGGVVGVWLQSNKVEEYLQLPIYYEDSGFVSDFSLYLKSFNGICRGMHEDYMKHKEEYQAEAKKLLVKRML